MSRDKQIEVFKDETTGEWVKKDEATGEMLELTEKDKAITGMIDVLESTNLPRMITNVDIAITLCEAGYRKQSESFSRPHENDGEWISVEERLPEEGGTYLVVLKEKHECEKEWNYHVDVASFTFEWDCIFHDWDEGQGIEITHWMPLPEPPKKGGE